MRISNSSLAELCRGPAPKCHPYVAQPPRVLPLMTTRQEQVVRLIREGVYTTKEIAPRMGWTPGTAKKLLCDLYTRLRKQGYAVDNLTSLAIFAFSPETLRRGEGC